MEIECPEERREGRWWRNMGLIVFCWFVYMKLLFGVLWTMGSDLVKTGE